jgi:hypothetical protein
MSVLVGAAVALLGLYFAGIIAVDTYQQWQIPDQRPTRGELVAYSCTALLCLAGGAAALTAALG